ncbi:MAG: hypothetical protein RJQ09_05035 [Cyclobacteriaceae bacterium]
MIAENETLDFSRLRQLTNKLREKTATSDETIELLMILLNEDAITSDQFEDFQNGENVEQLLDAALSMSSILLLGDVLGKLAKQL